MRLYILIGLIIKLASGRPDTPSGYNYGAGGQQGEAAGPFPSGSFAPNAAFAPVITTQSPLINKHFYLHSAPEEDANQGLKHFLLGRPQKNYRVIFIKTPSKNLPRLSAEYAPQDEKTVVYVLSQKIPEFNPNDISTPAPTEPSKPEVFFIKYKTPEEAALAQNQIQAQYDALGGTSDVSDEGVAPVASVEGSLGPGGNGGLDNGFPAGAGGPGAGVYLPPSL